MSEKKVYNRRVFLGPGPHAPLAEQMRRIGEDLYGSKWIPELARALEPRHPDGKNVPAMMVHRWAHGQRTVPGWVWRAMVTLVVEKLERLTIDRDVLDSWIGDGDVE